MFIQKVVQRQEEMIIRENINIDDINNYGFVFHNYDSSIIVHGDDEHNIEVLESYVSSLIQIPNQRLVSDIDIINKGEEIKLHLHVTTGSFQVVVWVPDYEYEGRYFMYGTPNKIEKVQPKLGMMCFMKTNDSNFVHGVSKLLSDQPVKSYGISSIVYDLSKINDVFI